MHAHTGGRYTVKVEKDGVQYGPTYLIGVENASEALYAALSIAKASPEDQVNAPRPTSMDCTCKEVGGCCSDCPKAPPQDSMLDAAKLSLKEAERFEASAEEVERSPSNDCSPGSLDAERVEHLRKLGRDELLLANAQASIAVAEALSKLRESVAAPAPSFTEAVADAQADIEKKTGHKVGTAYVEVRPDFVGFDGQEFKQAVRNVVRDLL